MILAMLMGCSRRHYRPSLKDVLKHNPALEQVLERYEGNSLKTEAAEFLLMNLPYYYSYSEKDMEAYLKVHEYYGVICAVLSHCRVLRLLYTIPFAYAIVLVHLKICLHILFAIRIVVWKIH